MERIRCVAAVRGGIGQRIDNLHLFDDRAGPSVSNNQRQGIFVFRTDVNEMNVQPVDLGEELRQGVQFCFDLAPVVLGRPITRERLGGRELYALRRIRDGFSFGPLGGVDASAQFGEFGFRNIYMKWTNGGLVIGLIAALVCSTDLGHSGFLFGFLGLCCSRLCDRILFLRCASLMVAAENLITPDARTRNN